MFQAMPLAMLPEGEEGKVASINAGHGLKRHLVEMGFCENSVVKIHRADRGALVVIVNGSKYALGKGMATKIMVTDC
jgi:ferrous iron transport protein A